LSQSEWQLSWSAAFLQGTIPKKPDLKAQCIEDKSGHILPFVKFDGGSIELTEETLNILNSINKL